MKHKHYDLIIAWANGAKIEFKNDYGLWQAIGEPSWSNTIEYRIEPDDIVLLGKVDSGTFWILVDGKSNININPNIKLTFDGDTRILKAAEVIK